LLDYLKSENIKVTFFINGRNYGDIESAETQEIMKRQIREGHEIGSHTYFHRDCFQAYDEGTLKENIEKLEKGIKKIINLTPRFFRPPEGKGGFSKEYCEKIQIPYDPRTEMVRGILGGDGYKYGHDFGDYDYDIILWSGDTEDWRCDGSSVTYKDAIKSFDISLSPEVANPLENSFIVLMHDVNPYSVKEVVPRIVKRIKKLGYTIVPLSECIGRDPYKESKHKDSHHEDSKKEKTKTKVVENKTFSREVTVSPNKHIDIQSDHESGSSLKISSNENNDVVQNDNNEVQNNQTENNNGVAEEDGSGIQEDNSTTQENDNAVQEDNAGVQEDNSGVQEDNNVAQEDNNLAQEDNNIAQEDNGATQEGGNNVAQEDNYVAQEDNGATQEDNGIVQEENNIAPDGLTEIDNSELQQDNNVAQNNINSTLSTTNNNQSIPNDKDGSLKLLSLTFSSIIISIMFNIFNYLF